MLTKEKLRDLIERSEKSCSYSYYRKELNFEDIEQWIQELELDMGLSIQWDDMGDRNGGHANLVFWWE